MEQAKGMLMKQLDIDEAEAYRTMQKESMNRSISMKDLARAIIIAYKDN
ncbi:MAG TPA: ANTAR domain-containing protein [Syntrophomonas sp.]|nr:ANTAR domain-containing protein [Syntrophomonas sp.]